MAAAVAMAVQLHNICNSPSSTRRRSDAAVGIVVNGVTFIFPTTLSSNRFLMVLISKSQKDEANSSNLVAFTSQDEDLKYLLKIGDDSILGAASIKYESILFPEIRRLNILRALFMISTPVILSVILLIKKTRDD